MLPKQRALIALAGGRPDRVPFLLEGDYDFVAAAAGREPWEFSHAGPEQRASLHETCYLRHGVDLWKCGTGIARSKLLTREILQERGRPIYHDLRTGRRFPIDRRGSLLGENGEPVVLGPNGEVRSLDWGAKFMTSHDYTRPVETEDDILELLGPTPPDAYWIEEGRLCTLEYLQPRYGDSHFLMFTSPALFPETLDLFGGYEEGLAALYTKRTLFHRALAAVVEGKKSKVRAGAALGADGVYLIEYCAGADTISPAAYREFVYPYEIEIVREAHRLGLKVILWYLGDLMPLLPDIAQLGADALFPEQGRKGYEVDMVELRRRLGDQACLVGFNQEEPLAEGDQEALDREMARQIAGAGSEGAFIMGTTIVTEAVSQESMAGYVGALQRLGRYGGG